MENKVPECKIADDAANRLGIKKRFGSSTISVPVNDVLAIAGVVKLAVFERIGTWQRNRRGRRAIKIISHDEKEDNLIQSNWKTNKSPRR